MFLKDKKILITGLANKYSIAAGIAHAMHREGASLAFTYQNERMLKNLAPIANELGSSILIECDVSCDDSIKKSYNDLRSKTDEMTRHLDDIRLQMERDKRSMLDIKSKKTTFESDLTRIMDEVKFQKNICDLESKRAEECSMTTTKAREELGRVNVELVAARSKLQESKAREVELLRREKDSHHGSSSHSSSIAP